MSAYKDRATMGVMLGLLAMYFVFCGPAWPEQNWQAEDAGRGCRPYRGHHVCWDARHGPGCGV